MGFPSGDTPAGVGFSLGRTSAGANYFRLHLVCIEYDHAAIEVEAWWNVFDFGTIALGRVGELQPEIELGVHHA